MTRRPSGAMYLALYSRCVACVSCHHHGLAPSLGGFEKCAYMMAIIRPDMPVCGGAKPLVANRPHGTHWNRQGSCYAHLALPHSACAVWRFSDTVRVQGNLRGTCIGHGEQLMVVFVICDWCTARIAVTPLNYYPHCEMLTDHLPGFWPGAPRGDTGTVLPGRCACPGTLCQWRLAGWVHFA